MRSISSVSAKQRKRPEPRRTSTLLGGLKKGGEGRHVDQLACHGYQHDTAGNLLNGIR